jgi:hypothetical protein
VVPLVVGVELRPFRVEGVTRHDLHLLVDIERFGVLLHPLRHRVASRVPAELEHDHELDHPMRSLRILDGRRQSGRVDRLDRREIGVDVEVPVEERADDVDLLLGGTPVDARGAEQAACDRLGELLVHGSHAFLLPWTLRASSS